MWPTLGIFNTNTPTGATNALTDSAIETVFGNCDAIRVQCGLNCARPF